MTRHTATAGPAALHTTSVGRVDASGFSIFFHEGGYFALPASHGALVVDLLDKGEYELVLWAPDQPELMRRVQLFEQFYPQLCAIKSAFESMQSAVAVAAIRRATAGALDLLQALRDAYQASPNSSLLQTFLGYICLACGREEEGLFHLRGAIPGQDEVFSIGRRVDRLCFEPELVKDCLALATAYQAYGRHEEGNALLRVVRAKMRGWEIARICERLPNNVLWRRPDIVGRIRGIIQVGANVGDEIEAFGRLGVRNLIAFEPVPSAYEELVRTMNEHARSDFDWRAVPMAVADEVGSLQFWVGRKSGNSSFLELNPDRSAHHVANVHDRQITVPTTTLDRFIVDDNIEIASYNMIFMDVQGTEHLVLLGAREVLKHIDYVCLEVSYTEIYLGSWMSGRMEELFGELGFDKLVEEPGCFAEQADAIYVRRGAEAQGTIGQ